MLLAAAASVPVSASAQARRLDLSDMGRLTALADPSLSPDGQRLLVRASRPDYEANRHASDVVVIDLPSGSQRVLLRDRELGAAEWSPTGERIAFVAEGRLWVTAIDGTQARQLTSAPTPVQQFAWRPDGGAIAFAAADEVRPAAEPNQDAFVVGNNDYLATAPPASVHLWLAFPDGASSRRLTAGAWSLGTSLAPPAWRTRGRGTRPATQSDSGT